MRPGSLPGAQQFKGTAHLQNTEIIKTLPGNLQADGQAAAGVATVDAGRRLLGHVVGHGEANVLQPMKRVIGGRGQLGREPGKTMRDPGGGNHSNTGPPAETPGR